jgi:hypothetical protein
MATITINIVNADATRIGNAVAARQGYTGFLPDGVTPQTKLEFVKVVVSRFLKHELKMYDAAIADQAARDAVESGVILT